jgi:hypothetical protein
MLTAGEGSRGNLRAAVDQRAERFFLQNIPAPTPPSGPPIGSHHGRVWMYAQGCVASTERTALGGEALREVASGRTGVHAKADILLRARSTLHRPELPSETDTAAEVASRDAPSLN